MKRKSVEFSFVVKKFNSFRIGRGGKGEPNKIPGNCSLWALTINCLTCLLNLDGKYVVGMHVSLYLNSEVLTLYLLWKRISGISKNHLPDLKWNCKHENLLVPWEIQERHLSERDLKLGLTRSSTVTAAKALILEDTVL